MKKHIFGKFKIVAMQLNFLPGIWQLQLNFYLKTMKSFIFHIYRLLGLQVSTNIMWKIEQMKFMLENALFTNASEKYYISHELAGEIYTIVY